VTLDGSLDDTFVQVMIDESYALVVARLSRARRAALTEERGASPAGHSI